MGKRATLYVSGLSGSTRAKDVAKEFERFGQLVRCDIPTPSGRSRGYAFVEFMEEHDAESAYDKTQNLRIDGRDVKVEWARREPAAGWDHQRRRSPPRRSPSPRRDRSPPRDRDRDRAPPRRDDRRDDRDRRRSPSPRRDDRDRNRK